MDVDEDEDNNSGSSAQQGRIINQLKLNLTEAKEINEGLHKFCVDNIFANANAALIAKNSASANSNSHENGAPASKKAKQSLNHY